MTQRYSFVLMCGLVMTGIVVLKETKSLQVLIKDKVKELHA